jgi:hypothetical protein
MRRRSTACPTCSRRCEARWPPCFVAVDAYREKDQTKTETGAAQSVQSH